MPKPPLIRCAILATHAPDFQVQEIPNTYQGTRAAVGNLIQLVPIEAPVTVFCDEEGKLNGALPTAFWIDPETGETLDILCGNLVCFGPEDEDGENTPLTDETLVEIRRHIRPIPLVDRDEALEFVPEPVFSVISFAR